MSYAELLLPHREYTHPYNTKHHPLSEIEAVMHDTYSAANRAALQQEIRRILAKSRPCDCHLCSSTSAM